MDLVSPQSTDRWQTDNHHAMAVYMSSTMFLRFLLQNGMWALMICTCLCNKISKPHHQYFSIDYEVKNLKINSKITKIGDSIFWKWNFVHIIMIVLEWILTFLAQKLPIMCYIMYYIIHKAGTTSALWFHTLQFFPPVTRFFTNESQLKDSPNYKLV